jgi:MarR family transcriptional regulator, lower aerobic nicotinate degradation pathway regulator
VLGVVQRLAQRGLVAVRTDPADGRRRLVQLTHDGHELARELVAIGPTISCETLEGLSEKEQRELLRLLDRLGRKG